MERLQTASCGALTGTLLRGQHDVGKYRNSLTATFLGSAKAKGTYTARCGRSSTSLAIVATACLVSALASLMGNPHCAEAVEYHPTAPTDRFELVMLEEQGCGYCRRWHKEVGLSYELSDEGKRAPLKRIDLASTEAAQFARVVYTPTFVLVRNGEEHGRITGYPGADFFWSMLSDRLRRLDQNKENPVEGPTAPFNPYQDCDD